MAQEIIESLWESLKTNYLRCQKVLGLPEYSKILFKKQDGTMDVVKITNELVVLLGDLSLKNNWDARKISTGKNLLFLLHKINGIQKSNIEEVINYESRH